MLFDNDVNYTEVYIYTNPFALDIGSHNRL